MVGYAAQIGVQSAAMAFITVCEVREHGSSTCCHLVQLVQHPTLVVGVGDIEALGRQQTRHAVALEPGIVGQGGNLVQAPRR